jgi:3D (Asp-Asp-Asp) domain-containing protein
MLAAVILSSCATQTKPITTSAHTAAKQTRMMVRTTAYCRNESGGVRYNAIGSYLSGRHVVSAASDWSRFPLGTRFRIAGNLEEYLIDDYGGALVGTNTIDIYKNSRSEMRRWGVRKVEIEILQWGSEEQSLKVLTPRAKHALVRRMVAALNKKVAQNERRL